MAPDLLVLWYCQILADVVGLMHLSISAGFHPSSIFCAWAKASNSHLLLAAISSFVAHGCHLLHHLLLFSQALMTLAALRSQVIVPLYAFFRRLEQISSP